MNLKITLLQDICNQCTYKVTYVSEPNSTELSAEVTPVRSNSITYNWNNDALPEFVMDFFEKWYEK